MRQRRHDIQDIAEGSGLMVIACGGEHILSWSCFYAFFKPPDAIDKADLPLMHNQFDGIKILLAVKAPGKIMSGIDRGIKTAAYRAGKGKPAVCASGREFEHGLDNAGYRNPVA